MPQGQQTEPKRGGILPHLGGMDKKKLEIMVVIIVIAVMLLIYFSTFSSGDEQSGGTEQTAQSQQTFSAASEEEKLVKVLSQIQGAGKVEVMITYEGTSEKIPAYNSDTQTSSTSEEADGTNRVIENAIESKQPLTEEGGAVVISEKRPEVLGVIVVAEGAGDMNVKMELQRAVSTALGVSAQQVDIFVMNQE